MKKILVTGGSGFIGTNLISTLLKLKQYSVCSLDLVKPKIKSHQEIWKVVDIRDKEALLIEINDFNPNFVIHLAARTDLNGKTLDEYNSNSLGVSNLVEALSDLTSLERVIFASSMYVCQPGYAPKDFEDYKPHTLYGESKVLTEKIIKSAEITYPWAIIRPTSIWGPWFGEPYVNFFKIVITRKYFHMGSKACSKTYGYVENTVYQLLSLLETEPNNMNKKVFYIGDWPAYDISEWADEIAECIGLKIPKIPFFLFRLAGWGGDIFKLIGIKFPMTSFRLTNMTTDNIHNLNPIREIAPNLPVSRKKATAITIGWIRSNK